VRGVFFSRTYVTDFCRDSVFTYFGKRGVTKEERKAWLLGFVERFLGADVGESLTWIGIQWLACSLS